MKKLEIIIKPERLEVLKEILSAEGVSGIMVTNIMGYGNQKGRTQIYRGVEYGCLLYTSPASIAPAAHSVLNGKEHQRYNVVCPGDQGQTDKGFTIENSLKIRLSPFGPVKEKCQGRPLLPWKSGGIEPPDFLPVGARIQKFQLHLFSLLPI